MRIKFIQNFIDRLRGKTVVDWSDKNLYKKNILNSYKAYFGNYPDIENPKTFSEKMMWLRLYDNTPLKTMCADKYKVRAYVKERIGEEYLVPLFGVYDKFDDIDFDKLPESFVIKCNHGCGYNIIVKNKKELDIKTARKQINKWLKQDFGKLYGEAHYSGIKPKIMVEKYLEELVGDISDYKYFCFNGKPEYILYCSDRKSGILKNSFFDLDGNNLYFNYCDELYKKERLDVLNLDLMRSLAEKLAKDFKHVRVDFYNLEGRIYFGELTFTSYGGYIKFSNPELDEKIGNLLEL